MHAECCEECYLFIHIDINIELSVAPTQFVTFTPLGSIAISCNGISFLSEMGLGYKNCHIANIYQTYPFHGTSKACIETLVQATEGM